MGKKLSKHKRESQYTLHSSDGTLNFTLWKDGSVVLFADNDFDANLNWIKSRKFDFVLIVNNRSLRASLPLPAADNLCESTLLALKKYSRKQTRYYTSSSFTGSFSSKLP